MFDHLFEAQFLESRDIKEMNIYLILKDALISIANETYCVQPVKSVLEDLDPESEDFEEIDYLEYKLCKLNRFFRKPVIRAFLEWGYEKSKAFTQVKILIVDGENIPINLETQITYALDKMKLELPNHTFNYDIITGNGNYKHRVQVKGITD